MIPYLTSIIVSIIIVVLCYIAMEIDCKQVDGYDKWCELNKNWAKDCLFVIWIFVVMLIPLVNLIVSIYCFFQLEKTSEEVISELKKEIRNL